jgi:hypothetical protein
MIKNFRYLALLLFLVACGRAPGEEGGACLEGNICEHDHLVCSEGGTCVICGFEGDPCCEDGSCREQHICGADGICAACGWHQTACCEGDICVEGKACGEDGLCHMCGGSGDICCEGHICNQGYTCNSDNECEACGFINRPCCDQGVCNEGYVCGDDNICASCGWADSSCCPGNTCKEGYVCTEANLCESCGGLGQLVCDENLCKGWFAPDEGFCADPFEADVTTDTGICERAEQGDSERHYRAWCYWYAAFSKGNASLCAKIEWDKMREVCEGGEDPNDYEITWTIR